MCITPKDKVISLLELVLNNSVFYLQGNFYQQIQGAALGSLVSPVITNIYMEYFEELAIGPECTISRPWWKRYVDDVISIVKENQLDTFFSNLNSVDPHIKLTMESPDTDGSILFLNNKCLPNKDHSIQTSVYRKTNLTDW